MSAVAHKKEGAGVEARFRSAYRVVGECLNRFAAESESRYGDAAGVALRFVEAGSNQHVMVLVRFRAHSAVAATLVWAERSLTINRKSRTARLFPNRRGAASEVFCRILTDQLVVSLDGLRDASVRGVA